MALADEVRDRAAQRVGVLGASITVLRGDRLGRRALLDRLLELAPEALALELLPEGEKALEQQRAARLEVGGQHLQATVGGAMGRLGGEGRVEIVGVACDAAQVSGVAGAQLVEQSED